mmetsp:Transcript_36867/g.85709  ORF Transcript_36867/g.85709 Transcript_36867/m.85709 type:complete len:341 (+) Transcript_36867:931-1953(+)
MVTHDARNGVEEERGIDGGVRLAHEDLEGGGLERRRLSQRTGCGSLEDVDERSETMDGVLIGFAAGKVHRAVGEQADRDGAAPPNVEAKRSLVAEATRRRDQGFDLSDGLAAKLDARDDACKSHEINPLIQGKLERCSRDLELQGRAGRLVERNDRRLSDGGRGHHGDCLCHGLNGNQLMWLSLLDCGKVRGDFQLRHKRSNQVIILTPQKLSQQIFRRGSAEIEGLNIGLHGLVRHSSNFVRHLSNLAERAELRATRVTAALGRRRRCEHPRFRQLLQAVQAVQAVHVKLSGVIVTRVIVIKSWGVERILSVEEKVSGFLEGRIEGCLYFQPILVLMSE